MLRTLKGLKMGLQTRGLIIDFRSEETIMTLETV